MVPLSNPSLKTPVDVLALADGDGCRVGGVANVVGGAGDEGVLAGELAGCSTSLA